MHNKCQSVRSQTSDIWSYGPELGNRFCIFRWASARFPCPLIDPVLQQQGRPLLQRPYLGVLCSLFDVQYCVLDCYYQLSELRSPIPLFPVSEGDRMDASSFLSLPIITGGKRGWALKERKCTQACNVQLKEFVKWGSFSRKSTTLGPDIQVSLMESNNT